MNYGVVSGALPVAVPSVMPQGNFGLKSDTGGSIPPSLEENVSNKGDIEKLIIKYFGKDADMAVAIAKCESGLNPSRIGDGHLRFEKDGRLFGASYGVFQVRDLPGRFDDPDKMLNAEENIKWAKSLFDRSGWTPWSCYTNSGYERFI